jgi:hypothetical protein
LVAFFQLQVGIDDLWNIRLGYLHIPEPFGPNHHVGAKGAYIQAPAADDANFTLQVSFLANFSQFFDDLFRATITAGGTLPVTVVDTDVNLPDIGLGPLNHGFSLRVIKSKDFIAEKNKVCTQPGIGYFIPRSSIFSSWNGLPAGTVKACISGRLGAND